MRGDRAEKTFKGISSSAFLSALRVFLAIRALRMLENKVDSMPRKKHGNIPLLGPGSSQTLRGRPAAVLRGSRSPISCAAVTESTP
jgi:hypothetical protein